MAGWFREKVASWAGVKYTKEGGNHMTFQEVNTTSMHVPTEITADNGYEIAKSLSEVFTPIDIIASACAKLIATVYLTDGEKELTLPENLKKIIDQPNPYYTLSDMVYNYIFSQLSDGNSYLYSRAPEAVTQDTINALFLLEPDMTTVVIKSTNKYLKAVKIEDAIKEYTYKLDNEKIPPEKMVHSRYTMLARTESNPYVCRSPLLAAKQNIDNLLASYSARYNIFVNNGSAVIIAPKGTNNSKEIYNVAQDPATRDDIAADLNNRQGLVGTKSIKAISSVPIEAVNTIATIKDLEPYTEAEADMYCIAGILEVDRDLLPSKEGTTFTNKEVAEAKLLNGVAIPLTKAFCADLTKATRVKNGYFDIKTDGVGFLEDNRKKELEGDKLLLENLSTLDAIEDVPTKTAVAEIRKQILERYGKK